MREGKHKVIVNGTPKLENMPKDAFKVFCSSLLSEIEEYYKGENPIENSFPSDKAITLGDK